MLLRQSAVLVSLLLASPAAAQPVVTLEGHRGPVWYVEFAADGRSLRAGTGTEWYCRLTDELLTWDVAKGKLLARSRFAALEKDFAAQLVSPDHTLAVIDAEGGSATFDLANRKTLAPLALGSETVLYSQGLFSPGKRVLVAPSAAVRAPLCVFDVSTGKLLGRLPLQALARVPAFAADEQALSWYEPNGTITVAGTDGKVRRTLGQPKDGSYLLVRVALAFSTDGESLAGWDAVRREVVVWELARGKERYRLPPPDVTGVPRALAWSPDGRTLAVALHAKDCAIRLYEAATGKLRRTLTGHRDWVESLAWSPDGRLLASGSADATVVFWDVYAAAGR
jgi:WD40 repeat protein